MSSPGVLEGPAHQPACSKKPGVEPPTSRKRRKSQTEPQDEKSSSSKQARLEDKCHLLSLSDDVLMIILDHLDSVSLLSLGQTCLRLSNVTADPNLWKVVDLSCVSSSVSQLKQRLKHINAKTRSIKIKGFFTSRTNLALRQPDGLSDPDQRRIWEREFRVTPDHNLTGEPEASVDRSKETLTTALMSTIQSKCPLLEELHLLCVNVNANNLSMVQSLPISLTTLSIVHCNFFNLDPSQSPFFGIHMSVPDLKVLDISWNPGWVTNHSLGSVCKCLDLRTLNLRGCVRIGELFAYTALATRFGFRNLERLDARDTSAGNSEVPCFGALPKLTHLLLGHSLGTHCSTYQSPTGSESDGRITDRALLTFVREEIAPKNNLRFLDLWNCHITLPMIQELAKRKHFEWINFSGTGTNSDPEKPPEPDSNAPYRTLLNMKELPEVVKTGPGFVGQEDQIIVVQMM